MVTNVVRPLQFTAVINALTDTHTVYIVRRSSALCLGNERFAISTRGPALIF
jgi:hypothetical protein